MYNIVLQLTAKTRREKGKRREHQVEDRKRERKLYKIFERKREKGNNLAELKNCKRGNKT